MIKLTPPTKPSSQILALGYDSVNREIYIQFPNGTYKYHDCMQSDFDKLNNSPSLGHYVSKELAPNKSFTKIKIEE